MVVSRVIDSAFLNSFIGLIFYYFFKFDIFYQYETNKFSLPISCKECKQYCINSILKAANVISLCGSF